MVMGENRRKSVKQQGDASGKNWIAERVVGLGNTSTGVNGTRSRGGDRDKTPNTGPRLAPKHEEECPGYHDRTLRAVNVLGMFRRERE